MADDLAVRTPDPEIIERFLENVRGTVPLTIEQIETILRLINAATGTVRSYLDLACVSSVTAAVMAEFPAAEAVIIDPSMRRLEATRQQLGKPAHRAQFLPALFDRLEWPRVASLRAPYDLIASGVELPLLPPERQRPFYASAFDLLRPGGFFLTVQYVASATRWTESRWDDQMIETIFGGSFQVNDKRPRSEIARAYYEQLEDKRRVAPLEVQCDWLRELGFENVDCYLKIAELAVFGGQRPG